MSLECFLGVLSQNGLKIGFLGENMTNHVFPATTMTGF
jgi:hypothetical protein